MNRWKCWNRLLVAALSLAVITVTSALCTPPLAAVTYTEGIQTGPMPIGQGWGPAASYGMRAEITTPATVGAHNTIKAVVGGYYSTPSGQNYHRVGFIINYNESFPRWWGERTTSAGTIEGFYCLIGGTSVSPWNDTRYYRVSYWESGRYRLFIDGVWYVESYSGSGNPIPHYAAALVSGTGADLHASYDVAERQMTKWDENSWYPLRNWDMQLDTSYYALTIYAHGPGNSWWDVFNVSHN